MVKINEMKKDILFLIIAGISLLLSIFKCTLFSIDLAWIAIILCGIPIIKEAVEGLVTEFDIKADVLVSIALIASVFIGEIFAAGEVAFIMQLGSLLEELTVAKARAGIEKLVHLTPQTARKIVDDKEDIIDANKVLKNDILRVLPGETVPVDGVIIEGETSINQAVMTGESIPVDKTVGDEVSSGTVNQFGSFKMKALKVGEDSSIQRMIKLVQSADANKAKIVGFADHFATWVVIIALSAALLTWLISGQIIRAVTILVVFCPCSLVLATPTAIMAAIGNATKHGFLVREGDALERLAKISKITFDKTGTLTYGRPEVIDVCSVDEKLSHEKLFQYFASAEFSSEHPIGKSIVRCYQEKYHQDLLSTDQFKLYLGKGISCYLDNQEILAGNEKLFKEFNDFSNLKKQTKDYAAKGYTIIYLAINQKLKGYLVLADTLRKESKTMIQQLYNIPVSPILLTGDHQNVASTMAQELGIKDVYADCLPEDKIKTIRMFQDKQQDVCMIGDGINDAPALKCANVGIAMGKIGSDIAVDAADIVLVDDDVKELPHLILLSKHMMKVIKLNLTFSMTLNVIAIILAIIGILNPVVGALVHNAGSVLVIVNSAFLLNWKK